MIRDLLAASAALVILLALTQGRTSPLVHGVTATVDQAIYAVFRG